MEEPKPVETQLDKLTSVALVWVAVTLLVLLAACTSDSTPEAEVPEFQRPNVTTKIATTSRPSTVDERLLIFLNSSVENVSADITFEIYNDEDDGPTANERVTVNLGDVVEFAGWEIHVEAIGPTDILYWVIDPDGQRFGGEPRE